MDGCSLHEGLQLLALPHELLSMVWRRLDNKTLKSARLTSKRLEQLSTPLLFQTFAIFPHVRSFETFVRAAKTSYVAKHIYNLEFDARFFRKTRDIVKFGDKAVLADGIPVASVSKSLEAAEAIHNTHLWAESPTDSLAQAGYLSKAFAHLPNLNAVHIRDACYVPADDDLPTFYARLLDEVVALNIDWSCEYSFAGSDDSHGTYTSAMLTALASLQSPLQHLEITGLSWRHFLSVNRWVKHPMLICGVYYGLLSLNLRSQYTPLRGTSATNKLQVLLQTADSLERLALDFQQCSDSVEYYGLNSGKIVDKHRSLFHNSDPTRHEIPARLTWSMRLARLRLEHIMCKSEELKSVLRYCSKTLRSLALSCVILMPDERFGPRACFVDMFRWMHKCLELQQISLEGFFANGGMQGWFTRLKGRYQTEDRHSPPDLCLQEIIHDFILKGGPCPLDHVAIAPGHYDLHKKVCTAGVPAALTAKEYAGDYSWVMEYDDRDSSDDEASMSDDIDDEIIDTDGDEDDDYF